MRPWVQALVAYPLSPVKIRRALDDMQRHGMPDGAEIRQRDLPEGLELRARW